MFLFKTLMDLLDAGNARYISYLHHIRIESWIDTWLLPFIAVAIIGLCFWHYSREKTLNKKQKATLISLRSLAYISLLLILAFPKLSIEGEGALPGSASVVLDASESMQIKDDNEKERFNKAAEIFKTLKDDTRYRKEIKTEGFAAGKEFKEIENTDKLPADAEYTSINQMLEKGIEKQKGEYCPGIVLITDGAHNSPEDPENAIKLFQKLGIPVYVCGLGKEKSKDISAEYILGEDVVFLNEKAKIYVNVNQNGYTDDDCELNLYLGDKAVYNGRHKLDKDGEISLPVEYIPRTKGTYQLKVEISPMPGEVTKENNIYIKNVRVIDEKIKILMIFGTPSWEYRYLMGALERDKRVEVKAWLAGADKRLFRKGSDRLSLLASLPEKKDLGKAYDIIFISKIDAIALPPDFQLSMKKFVEEQGGSIAVIADMVTIPYSFKGTPLEEMMPLTITERTGRSYKNEMFDVLKDELKFDVTDDGSSHQLVAFSGNKDENKKIWSGLPPVYSCYTSGRLKPSAINLITLSAGGSRQKYPAIVFHSYGKGTVLFMGFDSTWRWRKEFGDRYFRDYWSKAVQFLGLPHLLNESAQSTIFIGKETCYSGEKISIRAKVSNPDYSPVITDAIKMVVNENGLDKQIDMHPVTSRPGIYKAEYMPEMPGTLKLSLPAQYSARPVELRIIKPQLEFHNSGLNKSLLEKLAKNTGGGYYAPEQAGQILQDLYKNRHKVPITVKISLWDSMLLLLLTLILFSAEWYFRKIYYLD